MKKLIIGLIIIAIIGFGIYLLTKNTSSPGDVISDEGTPPPPAEDTATTTPEATNPGQSVIGKSVEERDITAYHFGSGSKELVLVGGIHGGYAWNTSLLAYELADYLQANPTVVPANLKVTVIPVLNPDGLNKTVGTAGRFTAEDVPADTATQVAGRFNAHTVDLNRNFDCDWQASGKWQSKTVSGGSEAFSEPESQAIKNYIETNKPVAVVVWYSAAGGVYASNCHNGVLAETNTLTNKYAEASGYPAYQSFDFYEVTGDMVNWLAKSGIPAISVLLTNHTDTELTKNQAGLKALLTHYSE